MERTFELLDYCIFILTLSISLWISIYFGCFGSKQKRAKEYLYGSGNLSSVPIGLSLLSSAISALAVVGTVQEIYLFGTQILVSCVGMLLSLAISWNLILPVFCGNLNLKSPYEYFERRYDSKVRLLLSTIYVVHIALFSSVTLYLSTVSFSAASGIDLYICTTVIGIICTIYTLLGGFSGVIWTDVLQIILMFSSCLFIMFKGLNLSGGFIQLLVEANKGQRLQLLNFNPNPFVRLTAWSAMFGMMVNYVAHSSCAASGIQRFMALKTEKEARISTAITVFGFILIYCISGIIALCIYVYYADCDPIESKKISNPSQLLAFYVKDITKNTTGFMGLFNAGLLSAGLSSMSAELNTVSGLFYYDILIKIFKIRDSENRSTVIMKIIILVYGVIFIICAPLIQYFPYVFQLCISIVSWTHGAKLGIMILALAFPKTNSLGAFCGVIACIFTIAYISLKAMYIDTNSAYVLPRSVRNCSDFISNITEIVTNQTYMNPMKSETEFSIFKLSYMYFSVLGTFITILVGNIVSYVTGGNDVSKMDARLIIPCLRPGYENKFSWKFFLKNSQERNSSLNIEMANKNTNVEL